MHIKALSLPILAGLCLMTSIGCSAAKDTEKTSANDTKVSLANASAIDRLNHAIDVAKSTKGDGDPAMWRLADNDTTVYLFGTVHVLPSDVEWSTAKFTEALSASDTLFLEVDSMSPSAQAQMQQLVAAYGVLDEGQTLSSLLSDKENEIVTNAAASVGLPMGAIQQFKPWMVGLQLQVMQLMKNGYNVESGLEYILTNEANANNMTIRFLETPEDQISRIAIGSLEEQAEGLVFTAETFDMGANVVDTLVAEWADGDVAGLGAIVGDPTVFGSAKLYESLLIERNQNWIPQIVAMLDEPGTKFVAVGAGHLAGPDSVVSMLEDEGYKVEVFQ